LKIKGKLVELYTFRNVRVTTDLIFGITVDWEEQGIWKKVTDDIYRS
jgi:hypothetical protein